MGDKGGAEGGGAECLWEGWHIMVIKRKLLIDPCFSSLHINSHLTGFFLWLVGLSAAIMNSYVSHIMYRSRTKLKASVEDILKG